MTLLEELTQSLEGKDIGKLIHEAKAESESRILGQGIAYVALFVSYDEHFRDLSPLLTWCKPEEI